MVDMIAVLTAVMFTIFAYQSSKPAVDKNYTVEVDVAKPMSLDAGCNKYFNCIDKESK
jgi:hypothetical protein